MTAPRKLWRPADEAAAVATVTVFVEWLRQSVENPAADPLAVRGWAMRDRPAFHRAVARFAGLTPGGSLTDQLAEDSRPALTIAPASGPPVTWSRAAVRRRSGGLPAAVLRLLDGIGDDALAALAASHLLGHEIRPDQRLVWLGDPAEPWPFGAWIAGAQVVLGQVAPDANDRLFAQRPLGWADVALRPPA